MLSDRQQHCLKAIGIRRWRVRTAEDLAEPAEDSIAAAEFSAESALAALVPAPASSVAAVKEVETPPQISTATLKLDDWGLIDNAIQACTACELARHCTQKVPGAGNRQADLMIVGEGPGHDEDLQGMPFVGRSGQLLEKMLAAIGLTREQVFITNIVKCRPPDNRDPRPEEAQQCRAYLNAQIKQVHPKVILALGRVSAQNLLDSKQPVGKLIPQTHSLPGGDIPLKVTYHPSYLLRTPSAKAIAWQDMKLLQRLLKS